MMESSEEEDDFPTHEWITPQSQINSIYQSDTEKGIRKLCSELLDLKEAVENLCGNMHTKYLSFLRISEEVIEMEQELIELQKHVSSQGILVKDLISGVFCEIEEWNKVTSEPTPTEDDLQANELNRLFPPQKDSKSTFLENIEVLLAEHKIEEALLAFEEEEKSSPELNDESLSTEDSSYRDLFFKRKATLVGQLVEICEQPSVCISELKKALSGLLKLGKGLLAHQLLLKAYGSRLHRAIESLLPSCSIYLETYTAPLSQLVFTTISIVNKESGLIFGDVPTYANKIVQWAEYEIESFVRLVKENAPLSDSTSALRSASICVQSSLTHSSDLESQGLKFSRLVMVLLRPYVEEVLDMNFRRARRRILDLVGNDDMILLSPQLVLPLSASAISNIMLTNSGKKFMSIVTDILEQLTPMVILHFGGNILNRLPVLFDKYVESLMKALPGPSEDDSLTEPKEEGLDFRVETDAQQLALLGTASIVADEKLPMVVSRIFMLQNEGKEPGTVPSESVRPMAISPVEFKDWRRNLQHSLDKLRDHFCRQYVLTFIYSREGKTRLDARMYLDGKGENPFPSLPFQALLARLHQLATIAEDVLVEKEKLQKNLLARLVETVVMWLSDEQEFWGVLEDDSVSLQPSGLRQLILDIHFIVEYADSQRYVAKNVRPIASSIIARAIGTFSRRGIDPQSVLPADEWFSGTAKEAIKHLLLVTSHSESSEAEDAGGHLNFDDDDEEYVCNHDEDPSSPSSLHSTESFASATMGEIDSPTYFTDPET